MRMWIKRKFSFAVMVIVATAALCPGAPSHPGVFGSYAPVTVQRRAVLADAVDDKDLIRLSADGQLLAAGTGHGPIKLWDTRSGKLLADLAGTEGQTPRAFSPVDDRLLVSTHLKSLSLYDLEAMKLRSFVELETSLGSINFFERFSPDGKIFLIDSAGKNRVTVWETSTARMISSRACSEPLFKSTFSPDSKTVLSSCGGRKAILWDAHTGNVIAEFVPNERILLSRFAVDAKTVTTITDNGQVQDWDAGTGRSKNSWSSQKSIFYAAFSPDGQTLGTVGWNGMATLWDVGNQREKNRFRVSRSANHINFSADSRLVTTNGHANEVSVWRVADGAAVLRINDHEKRLRYASFGADNRLLISYSDDAINVWDLTTLSHVAKLDDARAMAVLSQDGKLLVTGGIKGRIILWEISQ